MTKPTKVRIGEFCFKIRWGKQNDEINQGRWGLFQPSELAISIADDVALQVQVNSLIHECMHGIYWASCAKLINKTDDFEETLVSLMSSYLMSFIIDNKDVVKWITSHVDG